MFSCNCRFAMYSQRELDKGVVYYGDGDIPKEAYRRATLGESLKAGYGIATASTQKKIVDCVTNIHPDVDIERSLILPRRQILNSLTKHFDLIRKPSKYDSDKKRCEARRRSFLKKTATLARGLKLSDKADIRASQLLLKCKNNFQVLAETCDCLAIPYLIQTETIIEDLVRNYQR